MTGLVAKGGWTFEVHREDGGPMVEVYAPLDDGPDGPGATLTVCTMGTTCCHGGWGGYGGEVEDAAAIAAVPELVALAEMVVKGIKHSDICSFAIRGFGECDCALVSPALKKIRDAAEAALAKIANGIRRWTDGAELIKRLEDADPQNDAMFRELVCESMEMLRLTDQQVAREFTCSIPTVTRWRTGAAAPHPLMRPAVYKWLREQIGKIR